MDEALVEVTVDFSNRPFLVYNLPEPSFGDCKFNIHVAKEFFYAFSVNSRINLHINGAYGDNEHHILESVFKSLGRALDQATLIDQRILSYQSTKGII
jgi:imidazoleglycerol-phosphate dehydratase